MQKQDLIKESFRKIANEMDCGNSTFTDEQCDVILDSFNKLTNIENKLSKYQACKYLNISRATFDNWVKSGKIPEGRKEQGFKEKFWYLSDLKDLKN